MLKDHATNDHESALNCAEHEHAFADSIGPYLTNHVRSQIITGSVNITENFEIMYSRVYSQGGFSVPPGASHCT